MDKNAAILVPDSEVLESIAEEIKKLVSDTELQTEMAKNMQKLAQPDAAKRIAEEIVKILE